MNNLFLGIFLGSIFSSLTIYLSIWNRIRVTSNEDISYFSNVLEAIKSGSFIRRVNDIVEISINLNGVDHVVFYTISNSNIAVFEGFKCVKTNVFEFNNQKTGEKIVFDIIKEINLKWSKEINDTVYINGSRFDVGTYKKWMSSWDETRFDTDRSCDEELDVDDIVDDILDKINKVGFDGLSDVEKNFLKSVK